MDAVLPYLLFVAGLICLIFGGDWFVDAASAIARRLGIPELLIGATIVSIGTTLPEVMVSADSAIKGHGEIAYGNAIGSIICNTALILAVTLVVKIVNVNRKDLILPAIAFLAAALVFVLSAYVFRTFYRVTGIILLVIFVIYMMISVKRSIFAGKAIQKSMDAPEPERNGKKSRGIAFNLIKLIAGAALIAVGADLLVDNGTLIAERMGVPESVIALTFVALGTSLPELVTAIASLIKKHSDLSVGNIIGANLFNLVLVSGLSITIAPFDVPSGKQVAGMNASLLIDIPVMLLVMLLVLIPVLIKQKTGRMQGIVLMVIYIAFLTVQFAI